MTKTEIRAPQDGLVIYARSSSRYNESYIKQGADIRKGYKVIDLPDVSELMAVVQVHESFVRHLRTGLPAVVRIDSLPDKEFKGIVKHVAPTPDSRRMYYENVSVYDTHVWIEDENDQLPEDLKPGVAAKAEIIIAEMKNVLKEPVQSVTTHNGKKVGQVKRGQAIELVRVDTGQFNNHFIEVKAGLQEGDLVSLSPHIDEEAQAAQTVKYVRYEPLADSRRPPRHQEPYAPQDALGAHHARHHFWRVLSHRDARHWRGRQLRGAGGYSKAWQPQHYHP